MTGIITLLIAHTDWLFATILPNLMRAHPGLNVVGHAVSAADLLAKASSEQPEVILADIGLPGINGPDTLQKLISKCPNSKIIFHWNYHHEHHLLMDAINAGCHGCIAFDARPPIYWFAIKQVAKGNNFYCDHTRKITGLDESELQTLNDKYQMMLCCMFMDYSTKDIATAVKLTTSTAHTYRKRLKKIIGSPGTAAKLKMLKEWMRSWILAAIIFN
ncbi:MAG: response regulator [Ginsengibacter sp.]